MKKYLVKILLFFIAIAVVDILFGNACQYMNDHSKGGGTKSRYYVCKESNDDVLVFGSSRAKHHYVPDVFEDGLKMTCYNAGEDGNGVIYCYAILRMITQRYTPKIIIYDVSDYDIYTDDNLKYLDLLKPYYYEQGIDSLFWQVEPKTRIMMISNLYRFNTSFLRVFGNFVCPMTNYPKGYSALYNSMDYEPENKEEKKGTIDDLKIRCFEKLIDLSKSKDIILICCVSPSYKEPPHEEYYEPIKRLCNNHGIPFLYFETDPTISNTKLFFNDRTHMNDNGARVYSGMLVDRLLDMRVFH